MTTSVNIIDSAIQMPQTAAAGHGQISRPSGGPPRFEVPGYASKVGGGPNEAAGQQMEERSCRAPTASQVPLGGLDRDGFRPESTAAKSGAEDGEKASVQPLQAKQEPAKESSQAKHAGAAQYGSDQYVCYAVSNYSTSRLAAMGIRGPALAQLLGSGRLKAAAQTHAGIKGSIAEMTSLSHADQTGLKMPVQPDKLHATTPDKVTDGGNSRANVTAVVSSPRIRMGQSPDTRADQPVWQPRAQAVVAAKSTQKGIEKDSPLGFFSNANRVGSGAAARESALVEKEALADKKTGSGRRTAEFSTTAPAAGKQIQEASAFGKNTKDLSVERVEIGGKPQQKSETDSSMNLFEANAQRTTGTDYIHDAGSAARTGRQQQTQLPGHTATSVMQQVRESIQTGVHDDDRRITIRLNPPELGRVSIKLQQSGHELTAVLEASKAQTRTEIQNAIPDMLRTLQAGGVQIKRVEVTLADAEHSSSQYAENDRLADLWQHAQDQGEQQNMVSHEQLFAEIAGYQNQYVYDLQTGACELPAVGARSLNMLM